MATGNDSISCVVTVPPTTVRVVSTAGVSAGVTTIAIGSHAVRTKREIELDILPGDCREIGFFFGGEIGERRS